MMEVLVEAVYWSPLKLMKYVRPDESRQQSQLVGLWDWLFGCDHHYMMHLV